MRAIHAAIFVLCVFVTACSQPPEQEEIAPDASPGATAEIARAEISITVPEDTPQVYLTGSLEALGPWDPAAQAMTGEGATRAAVLDIPPGTAFEYKFTLGSWQREAADYTGAALRNFELTVTEDMSVHHEIAMFKRDPSEYMADWRGGGIFGTLVYWPNVTSQYLTETRNVSVWLPPEYETDTDQRYRVIYMSDGQNLFDPRLANTGIDWGVDEAMVAGAEAGLYEPAIVVATWSTDRRFEEYSPWHNAEDYAQFLIAELMPRVNEEFRTLTGPENTFHMGASMGGLLSFYLVKEHPDTFSACGCVSSHFTLSDKVVAQFMWGDVEAADGTPWIERDIAAGEVMPAGQRLFFDYGTEGLDAAYGSPHAAVRAWLVTQGYVAGEGFVIRVYPGADHNEAAWRARVGDQLAWLLGDASTP